MGKMVVTCSFGCTIWIRQIGSRLLEFVVFRMDEGFFLNVLLKKNCHCESFKKNRKTTIPTVYVVDRLLVDTCSVYFKTT